MSLTKRKIAFGLAIIMLASLLAGCSNDSDNDRENEPGYTIGVDHTSPEFVYLSELIPFPDLPEGMTNIRTVTLADNTVYFIAWGHGEENNWFDAHGLFSMDIDGSDLVELLVYTDEALASDNTSSFITIDAMHVDSSGHIWIVESRGSFDHDLSDMSVILRKLDKNGTELSIFDISDLTAGNDWFHVSALNIDDTGNMYIASGASIYILNNQGILLFSLDNPDYFTHFVWLSDGTVALTSSQGLDIHLRRIDIERRTWGEIISLPSGIPGVRSVFSGNEEHLFLYNDRTHLNGFSVEAGEFKKLLSWTDSALSSDDVIGVMFLLDGRIAATRQLQAHTTLTEPVTELIILTKTSRDELPERKVLTYGTSYYDSGRRHSVEQFNRNSLTHRIHVIDYSEFNTSDDMSAGLLRLTTDIITGNSPDILDIWGIPLQSLVSKGFLLDLYPFLDMDIEINRNSMIESVLTASEIDGSLYRIVPSFSIGTIYGNPSVLGSYPGWNMDEFVAVFDANPQADKPMGFWTSDMWFLSVALMNTMDEYVDRASGTADFNTDEFVKLLELANTFPSEFDEDTSVSAMEMIASGRQIMTIGNFGQLEFLPFDLALYGGELVFKGYPAKNKDGNIFIASTSIAIAASCTDKDAAWEFVRIFLTEDHQRDNTPWSIPVNKVVFEEMLMETKKSPGFTLGAGDSDDDIVEIRGLLPNEVDTVRDLINNTTRMRSDDETLWLLISETAADYFNGMITAQDAARIIQNRVTIYLAEQS